ncbi:MAG TPA: hypothetical protein VLR72_05430 [Clostridiaceae bacterium]|nr:hypothetical protein [Clostridiaceae bacterium]
MDNTGFSGMILKVLDFLGGFWIIYWIFILFSAVSYDSQLLGYMIFTFLIYTFPAIIYLVYRKKIISKVRSRFSDMENPETAADDGYGPGYKEIRDDIEPAEIRNKLGILLAVLFVVIMLSLIFWMLLGK